jgi:peptidoglycan-associated lipoprotein
VVIFGSLIGGRFKNKLTAFSIQIDTQGTTQMAQLSIPSMLFGGRLQTAKLLVVACGVAVLAACSSTPLSDVPVVDKQGSSVAAMPAKSASAADGSQIAQRAVQPGTLEANQDNVAGPANAAKVIYFDYDSYTIKAEFQSALDAHAKFLSTNKTRKMAIEGHTDERGGREYNLALGQKRAEAVRRALGLLGVTDAQVEAVSFGKEKPANTGSDESSWALNRRAEINYR